jgi:hypothetical protein
MPPKPHKFKITKIQNNKSFVNSFVQTQQNHNITTRSMNQITKPKQLHIVTKYPLPQTFEPTCKRQAISQSQQRNAMSNELTTILKHRTWDVLPRPSNCTHVGCRWVFKV